MPSILSSIIRYCLVAGLSYLATKGIITQDQVGSANVAAWSNFAVGILTIVMAIAWSKLDKVLAQAKLDAGKNISFLQPIDTTNFEYPKQAFTPPATDAAQLIPPKITELSTPTVNPIIPTQGQEIK